MFVSFILEHSHLFCLDGEDTPMQQQQHTHRVVVSTHAKKVYSEEVNIDFVYSRILLTR